MSIAQHASGRAAVRIDRIDDVLALIERGAAEELLLPCGRLDPAAVSLVLLAGGIAEQLPVGLAVLDAELKILWRNQRFREFTREPANLAGQNFYEAFGAPEIQGPDFSPLHHALESRRVARTRLKINDKTFLQLEASALVREDGASVAGLVVVVSDVSREMLQQQKLNAIYQAGLELGNLLPEDVAEMTVQERVDLLKSKILHYTKDLLEFETVEIRLLERETSRLVPLLSSGMVPEAEQRELFARPEGNGVTGFVASTGKSYLCEDTSHDPLYLIGAEGARSSLTVPLILHEQILGTINVESPKPGAFSEEDLQFLELFSREVAVALNTLELLAAEQRSSTERSVGLILKEVATPVDQILNEATWCLDRYIGHEPSVADRLQRILNHTRAIKQLIQGIGETLTPEHPRAAGPARNRRPKLRRKRILVADNDDAVRSAAHELLGRFGCLVETAHNGEEALLMLRRGTYDAILVDIRLPDMTGYECLCKIREMNPTVPVILMTGFGYDPHHSLVKARQLGCQQALFKPFRLDQLITELEKAVDPPPPE